MLSNSARFQHPALSESAWALSDSKPGLGAAQCGVADATGGGLLLNILRRLGSISESFLQKLCRLFDCAPLLAGAFGC